MTLVIELSPQAEERLKQEAERRGMTLEELARTVLERETHPQRPRERVFGTHRGQVHIADDFDAELPDEFWLGKS